MEVDIMGYEEISTRLDEMPQKILDTEFGLSNPAVNLSFVHRLLPRAKETIEQGPNYDILRTGDGESGWIFLHNKTNGSADYVVKYQRRRWSWMPATVTQCILWRDLYSFEAQDLTKRMFFTYLLPRFGAILSDAQQTSYGRDFWVARMVNANARGLQVGIADMNGHKVAWFDQSTSLSLRQWLNGQETFGDAHRFQAIRYLISQKQDASG